MSEPMDEAALKAALRENIARYLASPEGREAVLRHLGEAVSEADRRRIIYGDAASLEIEFVEVDANEAVRSGIEFDETGKLIAYWLEPSPDASRFARGMAAYARCQDACQERAAGEPECRDSCRRAEAAMRRKG